MTTLRVNSNQNITCKLMKIRHEILRQKVLEELSVFSLNKLNHNDCIVSFINKKYDYTHSKSHGIYLTP